jgi:ketosteroid isomerase-like protein
MKSIALLSMAVVLTASASTAGAETATDKVKAVSQAFYAALNARDPSAMAKLYAHTRYVVHLNPQGSNLGWEAVDKGWERLRDATTQMGIVFTEIGEPQVVGDLAWEVGEEKGPIALKNGKVVNFAALATNIYQNIDGAWLMVSHQVGQNPP